MRTALNEEQRAALVDLLAHAYGVIDWSKFQTKSAHGFWCARITAAAKAPNMGALVTRIARQIGRESLPAECIRLAESLRADERIALYELNQQVTYYGVMSAERGKQIKADKKGKHE